MEASSVAKFACADTGSDKKALAEAAKKAQGKGPLGGGGIKKSGKK